MSHEFVVIHGNKWKKADIEESVEWAKTKMWVKEKWASGSEQWDHDHCQICWWKMYACHDGEHNTGYRNYKNDNWMCIECYEQFIGEKHNKLFKNDS